MCLPHLTEEKEEDQSVSRLSSSQILLPEVPKIIWIYMEWKNPFFFCNSDNNFTQISFCNTRHDLTNLFHMHQSPHGESQTLFSLKGNYLIMTLKTMLFWKDNMSQKLGGKRRQKPHRNLWWFFVLLWRRYTLLKWNIQDKISK